jgi:hypothetical protein
MLAASLPSTLTASVPPTLTASVGVVAAVGGLEHVLLRGRCLWNSVTRFLPPLWLLLLLLLLLLLR